MPLALGIAVAISSVLGTAPAASETAAPAPIVQVQSVRAGVESYFADLPIMVAIAQCESHFRQFTESGDVYRGKQNTKDVGVMQVNEFYHLDTATKLGYNLYTLEGNMGYARYLYNQEGTAPWSSSEACWGKTKAAKQLALAAK